MRRNCFIPSLAVALALPVAAHAQRSQEDAVANADDAFGSSVGAEHTGIYSENDARGFSPKKAGNVRIEGIYFDQVSSVTGRLRESTAIRVGFAAETYPFQAPTGIVDHRFRPFPSKAGASLSFNRAPYWGSFSELDIRLPLSGDRVALTGGISYADQRMTDGSESFSWGVTVRPIVKLGGVEISPFYHKAWYPRGRPQALAVIGGDALPNLPPVRRNLGETWTRAKFTNYMMGTTIKAAISGGLSFRGGLFHSGGKRIKAFSDVYLLLDDTGRSNHFLIADPEQDVHSTSGEGLIAWRFVTGKVRHRLFAGFRARDRYTESGGSDVLVSPRQPTYGDFDSIPERPFAFSPVNAGRVKQSSILLGYTGRIDGLGSLNLGVQRARYRATNRDGSTGQISASRDDPWLYNMTLGIDFSRTLSLYIGTEKGLEDSGIAPNNAANANAQLPSTRSTQYEGGLRWKFHGGQLVVNAFQITKPYFSFDTANVFSEQGVERIRGIETSLSGHFGKRLNLLAGAVLMQPRVTGAGRDAGLLGERPAGTPTFYAKLDANYRTDILGGLTPTLSVTYTGNRAVSARPFGSLGGRQVMVPAHTTVDLGLREQFHIGKLPASFRLVLMNAFDAASWKIVAANTIVPEERRRFSLSLTADF
ncbi:MAG: TonB-dependent receptor [Novosphingobium sp.]